MENLDSYKLTDIITAVCNMADYRWTPTSHAAELHSVQKAP